MIVSNLLAVLYYANGSTRLWKGMSYPQWQGSSSSGGGGGSSGVRTSARDHEHLKIGGAVIMSNLSAVLYYAAQVLQGPNSN